MKVLLSESMKPSKLKRHYLDTKHTDCKDLFFEQKANCVKRSRIAKLKQHTITEHECTDVSSCALERYVYYGMFKDEFLCILYLPHRTREKDLFKTIDIFFKVNDIKWELLCGLSTDGGPGMLGHSSGFHAHAIRKYPQTVLSCIV